MTKSQKSLGYACKSEFGRIQRFPVTDNRVNSAVLYVNSTRWIEFLLIKEGTQKQKEPNKINLIGQITPPTKGAKQISPDD